MARTEITATVTGSVWEVPVSVGDTVSAGDEVVIRLTVEARSTRSFTLGYTLSRGETQVGTAKTVHVSVDAATGKSCPLPEDLTRVLERQLG